MFIYQIKICSVCAFLGNHKGHDILLQSDLRTKTIAIFYETKRVQIRFKNFGFNETTNNFQGLFKKKLKEKFELMKKEMETE